MKRMRIIVLTILMVIGLKSTCFADVLTDFQAAQAQVAALTAQIQQVSVLAQTDPAQAQTLQILQSQLAQAQQNMVGLQPAAVQALQAQQAQALQAQQAAALQAQQAQALQAQQAAALQAQQAQALQTQQAAALQAQQAQALQAQKAAVAKNASVASVQGTSSAGGKDIVYIPATGDGNRYHVKGCRTIKHGEVAVTKAEAIAMGRSACGICHPH